MVDVKARQVAYYARLEDPAAEIERPYCYPRPVRFLLEFKVRSTVAGLCQLGADGPLLITCCGSGMDADLLARAGIRVVGLDLSHEALLRARERAERRGLSLELVRGDAENLPFKDGAFAVAFVHDGLHHLPDAYKGVREMVRVASRAVTIAEPADGILTRAAVRLGIAGRYEEAGNYVYRLKESDLASVFAQAGARRWSFRRDLIYYQPWTFRIYKLFDRGPMFALFKVWFYTCNLLLGRWGNSLKAVAWKY